MKTYFLAGLLLITAVALAQNNNQSKSETPSELRIVKTDKEVASTSKNTAVTEKSNSVVTAKKIISSNPNILPEEEVVYELTVGTKKSTPEKLNVITTNEK